MENTNRNIAISIFNNHNVNFDFMKKLKMLVSKSFDSFIQMCKINLRLVSTVFIRLMQFFKTRSLQLIHVIQLGVAGKIQLCSCEVLREARWTSFLLWKRDTLLTSCKVLHNWYVEIYISTMVKLTFTFASLCQRAVFWQNFSNFICIFMALDCKLINLLTSFMLPVRF